jgi:hypothetical protein
MKTEDLVTAFPIARKLGLKVKNLSAEHLYQMVKERKVSYQTIKDMDPLRFKDLEYTMKLIFNHEDDSVKHNHPMNLVLASHVSFDERNQAQPQAQSQRKMSNAGQQASQSGTGQLSAKKGKKSEEESHSSL